MYYSSLCSFPGKRKAVITKSGKPRIAGIYKNSTGVRYKKIYAKNVVNIQLKIDIKRLSNRTFSRSCILIILITYFLFFDRLHILVSRKSSFTPEVIGFTNQTDT